MKTPVERERPRESGFTLLEMLVAATLLALLMAVLFGGLRTGSRVWEASAVRGDDLARLQSAHSFLRQRIGELYPLRLTVSAGALSSLAFNGTSSSLTFTGLLPAHFNVGGFQTIHIEASEEEDRRDLTVAWLPFDARGSGSNTPSEDQKTHLIENVAEVRFSYFGAPEPGDEPTWLDEWRAQSAPPSLVRIEVSFQENDRRYWPELVVRVASSGAPPGAAADDGSIIREDGDNEYEDDERDNDD